MKKFFLLVAALTMLLPAGAAYADETVTTPFGWKGREATVANH